MPAQYSFDLIRRSGLQLALGGLILTIAAPWLGEPAAAQFMIGPAIGMGMGMLPPPVQQNNASPPPAEHRSHNVESTRRASAANKRHAKETPAKGPAKSDSNSSGAF
jgi:hypothetical protein